MTPEHQRYFEHQRRFEQQHPRHRDDPIQPQSVETDASLSPELRARWQNGHERHGKAFAAFLTLLDIDIRATDIIDQFESFYRGTFPDMRTFSDSFLEAMGWRANLDALVRSEPEFDWLVQWDYAEIEWHLRQLYDIIELDGHIYLFDR